MRINLGYPSPDDELRILDVQPSRTTLRSLKPVLNTQDVQALQNAVDQVKLDSSLADYVIAVATATRESDDLQVGISPRGSLAMAQAARATAVLDGRDYCVPEDVVSNVLPVCAHRIVSKTSMYEGDTLSARRIMQRLLEGVASPV
jgi:MoxR-like ATPase